MDECSKIQEITPQRASASAGSAHSPTPAPRQPSCTSSPSSSGPLVFPTSPPPSYEHVLAENRMAAAQAESSAAAAAAASAAQQEAGTPTGRTEILHKSSKELYRAVAAQWGITCKMSDHCRCLDCQSRYFDCEYDQNEQEKTDGGLSAGTPMFISEVIHGTACSIL
ncbi:uncharacterized protein LOC126249662 [Schistocerca nitens]|uniref:uncharacterized protein LOC126249662 n=1 Tax=Schistocerca nitens TaxID=7011 RepID=UPI0021176370|nr:uncharacterized protein LOC126249662 [Schistocerca nitens]XP_049844447.1 uncharacterized protein LOC126297558 [Schistocerca gregaria]